MHNTDASTRFWVKVNKDGPAPAHMPHLGPCWLWIGGRGGRGYGRFFVQPKIVPAHRFAYEEQHGKVPSGLWVLHHCDNPPCVNPAHLFVGDRFANMQDCARKGRNGGHVHPERVARGANGSGAKLTDSDVVEIRRRYSTGAASQQELADERGLSRTTVSLIVLGKTWTHLPLRALPHTKKTNTAQCNGCGRFAGTDGDGLGFCHDCGRDVEGEAFATPDAKGGTDE